MGGRNEVLITGGLGNLGSWLTRHFIHHGYEVSVLAKNRRNLVEDLSYEFIECDITDLKACRRCLADREFPLVIHAASVNDGFVDGYFELANRVNVLGTRNLLEVLQDKSLGHLIYFSTFQVYGQYSGTIDESTPAQPRNDYGATHLFAEYHIKQFHLNTGLPYTILRLTNSYGCPLDFNSSKWYLVLNDLSRSAFKEHKIVLKSNGKAQRDFIWMGTVANVVQRLLEGQASNRTFNLSGQQTYSMLEIAEMVRLAYLSRYGKEIDIVANINDKTQHPSDLFVSSQKLRALVSFEDKIRFENEAQGVFDLLEMKDKNT